MKTKNDFLPGCGVGRRPSSDAPAGRMRSNRWHRGILWSGLVWAACGMLQADPVAEWKFDGPAPLGGGQEVPLDFYDPAASGVSVLMEESSYVPEATGLGESWQEFLRKGFLDVGPAQGKTSANRQGLVTKNTVSDRLYPADNASYRAYLGFAGLGSGSRGGTVYLVVSPRDWSSGTLPLFGTGHLGGQVLLGLHNGRLRLTVGPWGSGATRATATVEQAWEADTWYFIAASWSGGQPPVLYVRALGSEGVKGAPAPELGTADGSVPDITEQPRYDPLVIGARWVNSGGGDSLFTENGANARFAWVRIDNVFSEKEAMEAVYSSLGTP